MTCSMMIDSQVPVSFWHEDLATLAYLINHVPTKRNKLDHCVEKCVFVGYDTHENGYRCYNSTTHPIHVTMNCDFLESKYFVSHQPSFGGESK